MPRTIVIGDVHLHPAREPSVARDLAALLQSCADDHVIFSGDLFELVMCPGRDAVERIDAVAHAFPDLVEALRLPRTVTFVAGNHDAGIAETAATERLRTLVRADLDVQHWYVRRGEVHIEHGNQYDPDNAFDDPEKPGHLPLGSFMMDRFLRHFGALDYLEDVEKRPGTVLWRTFVKFGPRAPVIIARYIWSSILAVVQAGDRVEPSADPAKLLFARPTTSSRWETFHRLHLGRIAIAALMTVAAGLVAMLDEASGWAATGLALVGVVAMTRRSHVRGRVMQSLASAALRVAALREARAVIFGHAHHAVDDPPYHNTGSFGLPRERAGRPYLIVEDDRAPRIVRAYFPRSERQRLKVAA